MHVSIRIFLVTCLFFKCSHTLDCSTQEVDFNATNNAFTIISDATDLATKNCKYTFVVPRNFVPTVVFLAMKLTGDNKITMKQYSEFGGTKIYNITGDAQHDLAPVNFTIEINLPHKTADDSFQIAVTVKDATPADTGKTFQVSKEVGTLIDYFSIPGNSSLLQHLDQNLPQATYTMQMVMFSDGLQSLLAQIHVYDGGVYKGSLDDVRTAPSRNIICSGSQFAFINTLSTSTGIFTVLVSQKSEWDESKTSATAAPNNGTSQTFTATDGATVFYEITNPIGFYTSPASYKKISFRGDGELNIYAGCVTGSDESKRIATITPANAGSWDHLMIYGRCKTFVLSKGVVQWNYSNIFLTDFRHQIGQKGIIMSSTYPYTRTDNTTFSNYLIQSPDANSKENIIVTYEVAHLASDITLNIKQEIKANDESIKILTSSDTSYTSVSTYQQYITFNDTKGSEGFLIRYTVTSSTSSFGALFVICLITLLNFH